MQAGKEMQQFRIVSHKHACNEVAALSHQLCHAFCLHQTKFAKIFATLHVHDTAQTFVTQPRQFHERHPTQDSSLHVLSHNVQLP